MTGSVVTGRDRDCLGCRIVGGTGLIGVGAYLAYQAKGNDRFPLHVKVIVYTLCSSICFMGVARIFNLLPNREKSVVITKKVLD